MNASTSNLAPGCAVGHLPGNSQSEMSAERRRESALSDLIDGVDLPAHLDLTECRELLAAVMAELFSRRRDFDTTAAEHNQTCLVFARAAIEREAERVAQAIAEEA